VRHCRANPGHVAGSNRPAFRAFPAARSGSRGMSRVRLRAVLIMLIAAELVLILILLSRR
jgi:hypothetical protein